MDHRVQYEHRARSPKIWRGGRWRVLDVLMISREADRDYSSDELVELSDVERPGIRAGKFLLFWEMRDPDVLGNKVDPDGLREDNLSSSAISHRVHSEVPVLSVSIRDPAR